MPVQNKPIIHARDHLEDGADPIRGLLTAPAGTIDEAILALDPGAYYKLNETGSDDWADSADARDATYISRTGEVRGVASGLDEGDGSLCVTVDGPTPGPSPAISDIGFCSDTFFCMPATAPFTVTARVRPAALPAGLWSMGICGTPDFAGGANGYGYGLYIFGSVHGGSGGEYGFYRATSGVLPAVVMTSGPAVVGEWVRLTGVYDGTNVSLYVDDTHIGDVATAGSLPPASSTTDTFRFGAAHISEGVGNPMQPYDGEIDSIAVWDRALDPSEIGGIADFETGGGAGSAGTVATSDGSGGVSWLKPTIDVKKDGTTTGTRAGLNLLEGAGVTITTADDSASNEVDVTISVSGDPVQETEIDAKGDLLAGTGPDTLDNLAVGTDGQVLTADSTVATGIKWATASGGSGPSDTAGWMPLTTVTGGVPELVWDAGDTLIPTYTPF